MWNFSEGYDEENEEYCDGSENGPAFRQSFAVEMNTSCFFSTNTHQFNLATHPYPNLNLVLYHDIGFF